MVIDGAAADLGGQPPAVKDEDAIGEADELGQFGRAEQDRSAAVGELADEPVDLALGTDVDAARRIVEQEHRRRDLEPLADDDLLLVAAGQLPDDLPRSIGPDPQPVDLAASRSAHRPAVKPRPPGRQRSDGHLGDVRRDARLEHQALAAAVGRDEADPRRAAAVGESGRAPSIGERDLAGTRPSRAEEHAEQRRDARALETGQADDLARARLEGDRAQLVADGQVADAQADGRRRRRGAAGAGLRGGRLGSWREQRLGVDADHRLDDLRHRRGGALDRHHDRARCASP